MMEGGPNALRTVAGRLPMTVLEILRPLTSHKAQQRGWQYLNQVHALAGDGRA